MKCCLKTCFGRHIWVCLHTWKYILLSLDFVYYRRIQMSLTCPPHYPIFLPSITLSLCFSLCTIVYYTRHLIYFLIQKRGSRKGSIDIKNIRCVEKVNLEEQTPVERQYPFQVRGEATFHWMDGSSFNIFYYELNIVGINKDTAKWFTKTMTRLGTFLDRRWECAYSNLGKWLELSQPLLLLYHE